jgi:hypothetical protein
MSHEISQQMQQMMSSTSATVSSRESLRIIAIRGMSLVLLDRLIGHLKDVRLAGVELTLDAFDDVVAGICSVIPFQCRDEDVIRARIARIIGFVGRVHHARSPAAPFSECDTGVHIVHDAADLSVE